MAITLEQAKSYLRVDFTDDDTYIQSLVDMSLIYMDLMVGEAYKTDEKAAKLADLLQLLLIATMYENRSINIPSNVKENRIVGSILDKLSNYTIA